VAAEVAEGDYCVARCNEERWGERRGGVGDVLIC
jgi:hypothetical protein